MSNRYQVCSRCVMDTTDPEISFDESGVCNHCFRFDSITKKNWFPNEEGEKKLEQIIEKIKKVGRGRSYDCILGISGGVDSSYLALKAKKWGLRPLAVHIDAGWNSELAVMNIERIIRHCGYDLYTQVINWDEMRELQLSYLRAAVSNQDVPQDHAFFAGLYHFAIKNKIRFVLSGGNIATESVFPAAWHGNAMDAVNLHAIHRRFGKLPLRQYKTINFFQYFFAYPFFRQMRTIRPLNYLPYHKARAVAELESTVGWRSYERKHGESLFTKFFQNHYLVVKFGHDKRRPHLSSLIMSSQITRDEALAELEEPLYLEGELEKDTEFFCKKLQLTRSEFNELMRTPIRHYSEFSNQDSVYIAVKWLQQKYERIFRTTIRVYS